MGDLHRSEPARAREAARSPAAGRVLLALGDAAFADLYRETLDSVGWHVEVAYDWRSAEERLLNSRPDVLVLNTLRDLKQTDALERIRRHPRTRELPVILLTDTLEPGDLERAKELGVRDLLIKSRSTRQTLSKTLRRVLEDRTESPGNGGDTGGPRSTDST
jgi:CheY-like chemotaxis protein